MADFTALKTAIQTYIKQNGNEEITGEKLQEILLSVVTTLGDSAINDLVTALVNEVAARQNADGTLQQNITNEATARGNADTALDGRIDDEATARANGDTALSNRLGTTITAENTAADQIGAEAEARAAADTALQLLIDGITENIENGYVYAGIATPSSTPTTGKVFYLALTAGTYTNFDNTEVSQGINILKYNGSAWSLDAFIGIDDELTPSSNNLPKSGNVLENIIKNGSAFDLSAYNAVDGVLATYADLDAALTALNALPAVYKQGGMSVKFVLTSDNNYIQARLMANSFTTDVTQWQCSTDEIKAGSKDLAESGAVASQVILKCIGTAHPSNEHLWLLGYQFESGKTYKAIKISGDGTNIGVGSTVSYPISTDDWTEFTAEQNYGAYVYVTTRNVAPVILITQSNNGIIQEDVTLRNLISQKINKSDTANSLDITVSGKVLDARQGKVLNDKIIALQNNTAVSRVTGEVSGSIFQYNGYQWEEGVTYLVKHISGYLRYITSENDGSDSVMLVNGQYVEFTPTDSDNHTPYTYASGGTSGKEAPVIDIVRKDSLFGEVEELKEQVTFKTTTIYVSRDGSSKSGKPISYSGLTAIKDALESITDASENNRYIIHVEGFFHFTDPLVGLMEAGGEYSCIVMKPFVDIVGDGPNNSVISMDFPANATFHPNKIYSDYQPIYFYGSGGKISGLKLIGKNCRYALHIETDGVLSKGKTVTVDNCEIEYQGHPDYTGSYGNCVGTGIEDGMVFDFKNSILKSYLGAVVFGIHTPLHRFAIPACVNFENITFFGNLNFSSYQIENNVFVNLKNCAFAQNGVSQITYISYKTITNAKHGLYNSILMNSNETKVLYKLGNPGVVKGTETCGAVLRVKSLSTGSTSVVRFNQNSSAFTAIIGNGEDEGANKTIYGWDSNYGYVFRDGGNGLSGQAFGTYDVDETASNNVSLGKLLGDCSVTNKALIVTIDGTEYTVTFNENYTAKDNDYVLNVINTVIGSVGIADVFSPVILYYPNINGLKEVVCDDENSILRGMGVVYTHKGIRRAKNSDGYIDGIALDDIAENQYGRIITKGYIGKQRSRDAAYEPLFFTTLDNIGSQMFLGTSCGISTTNDGVFDTAANPKVLREVHLGYRTDESNDWAALEIL